MVLSAEQIQAIKEGTQKAFGGPAVKAASTPAPGDTPPADTPPADTPPADPPPADVPPTDPPAAQPQANFDDISDEDFEKILAKRTNGKVKKLSELNEPVTKTKEEIEAAEAEEKKSALTWAFDNDIVSRDDYEKSIIDKSKSNRDIALSILAAELREDDPKITDAEVDEIYKDIYHEDKDDNSPLRKIALRKEAQIANAFKKEKYGKLDTIDADYRNFRSDVSRHKDYTKQVKSVLDTIPKESVIKVPIKIDDKDPGTEIEVKYTMDDADIKAIRDMLVDPEFYRAVGGDKKEVKDENILKLANYHMEARIAQKQRDFLLKTATEEAIKATLAWAKNIPQTRPPISTTTVLNNTNGNGKTPPSHAAYHNSKRN